MIYTYTPTTKKRTTSASKAVRPGEYIAEVTDVTFDEGYVDETMVLIRYKLTNGNGENFSYNERFRNSDTNQRTQAFLAYIEENGVNDILSEFIGQREKVTIKKVPYENGRVFLNIVKREFLNPEDK